MSDLQPDMLGAHHRGCNHRSLRDAMASLHNESAQDLPIVLGYQSLNILRLVQMPQRRIFLVRILLT